MENRSQLIQIKVTSTEKAEFDAAAKLERETISNWIRRALAKAIREQSK
jgi:uncharacterized protein (DUF1778 family)